MIFTTDIQLGDEYVDTVSGFQGKATACYFFLHGCERVLRERWMESAGEMREQTFDAPRLMHVESGVQATTTRTGGWKAEPPQKGPQR